MKRSILVSNDPSTTGIVFYCRFLPLITFDLWYGRKNPYIQKNKSIGSYVKYDWKIGILLRKNTYSACELLYIARRTPRNIILKNNVNIMVIVFVLYSKSFVW